jgi:parvulin-like peptidyl-prolyl isomerase
MEGQPTCPNCGAEINAATTNELTQGDVEQAATTEAATSEYATAPNEAPESAGEAEVNAPVNESEAVAGATSEPGEPTYETESDRAADEAFTTSTGASGVVAPAARNTGGMSATTKAFIAAGVAIVLALGFLVWQFKGRRNEAINITADDMSQLVQTVVPPQELSALANNPEERKNLAKQLRQILAIGQEARAAGFADKPEVQRQLETARGLILAQTYAEKQKKAGVTSPDQLFTNQEIDNFINEPGQKQNFEQFLKDAQDMGLMPAAAGISDQQKDQLMRTQWAPVQVLMRKAKAAGLDKERTTQLMFKLQESQILAQKYLPTLKQRVEATDQEIDAYIAKHPEFDTKQTRAKAEEVLKRVKAGEDFAALAKEYSTDPGSKDKGGELPWFKRGEMVKPFEDAAFSMQPGQTSDVIETPFGFHIIQTEEKRTTKGEDGKDEEEVRARHILIGYPSAQGNPLGPPQSPREQAKAAVEKEKRDKLIDDIAARQHVTVAEDFKVEAPPAPQMPPGLPGEDEGLPPAGADQQPGAPPVQSPHSNANTSRKKIDAGRQ